MLDFVACLLELFVIFMVGWVVLCIVLAVIGAATGSRTVQRACDWVMDVGSRPGDFMAAALELFVAAVAVMALGILALIPAVCAAFLVEAIRRA